MKIFIETERLILREIIPADEAGFFELDSNPNVHTYLGNNPVKTIEQVREAIQYIRQQYIDHGIGRWAIIDKVTNDFIGWTGLKLVKETRNNHTDYYDLGYRLIERYWDKGIATETAKATLTYAFEVLNLTEVYGICDVANKGSKNVLEKTGLKFIETFDLDGVEHNWFKITKEEWLNT
ncbi:GNAT family N-acetyltransferase [Runella sp.]|uniref:GNAT family N-acetyltransferase n=1 Tax=Runella sp. TaxID=1960881 RepID=UPI003D11E951